MRFLLFAPRAGVRFAGGLGRCGCELSCLVFDMFRTRQQIFDPGCTGQIGNYGSIPQSRVFSIAYSDDTDFFELALPALASRERWGAWSSGMIHP